MHDTLLHKSDNRPRWSGPKRIAKSKRRNHNRKSPSHTYNKDPRSSRNSARRPRSSNDRETRRPSPLNALVPSRSRNLKSHQPIEIFLSKTCRDSPSTSYTLTDSVLLTNCCGQHCGTWTVRHGEGSVRRLGAKTMKVGRSERVLLVIIGNYGSSDTVETYAEVRKKFDGLTPSRSVDGRIVD